MRVRGPLERGSSKRVPTVPEKGSEKGPAMGPEKDPEKGPDRDPPSRPRFRSLR